MSVDIVDKTEHVNNTCNIDFNCSYDVESTLDSMSIDIVDKTEHVGKICNTYLNKSHDVESTLSSISVGILDEIEHVGNTCNPDLNEFHDDESTLDDYPFISKLNNEASIENAAIHYFQCCQIYRDKMVLSEYIKSFGLAWDLV